MEKKTNILIHWGMLGAALFCLLPATEGRCEPLGQLILKRTTIKNFIADAVINRALSGSDATPHQLASTFEMILPSTEQTFVWSPALCRLIGIHRGKQTSFIEISAEGVHPFSVSTGARGTPVFFGFRLVAGAPEFLYTYGQMSIEERFEISADGRRLYQHFKIAASTANTTYTVPESWRKILTADNGRWMQTTLALNRQETMEGFTVTYHLDPQAPRPGLATPPPQPPAPASAQPQP